MKDLDSSDFQACLSSQPRKNSPTSSKIAQELATELLTLVGDDSNKAFAIIREIMYYSPNKSVKWYYERAVSQLNQKVYRTFA
jgi:hypothetical protein